MYFSNSPEALRRNSVEEALRNVNVPSHEAAQASVICICEHAATCMRVLVTCLSAKNAQSITGQSARDKTLSEASIVFALRVQEGNTPGLT